MSWILGLLGAVLGAVMAAASEEFFGFVAGALLGALLGMAIGQRGRVRALEQRLARVEALSRRGTAPAAATAEAAAGPPPAAAEPPPAAATSAAPPLPTDPVPPPVATETPARPAAGPPPIPVAPVRTAAMAAPAPSQAAAAPVDDTPRGPDVLEQVIATVRGWLFEGNVPVKIGLLVLMFGVAAALKYAADAGWLTMPIEFRLAGIAAGAIAGLVWGLRTARERPAFGLSVQGGAIGILLLTVFATYRYYHLIEAMPAFVMVIILVAGASVLAVRQNAPALAVLGFIGGYLAPVLISTGSGNHVALFSYYAVLNAAVFAIAWKRPWRALNLVGFVFTFAIGGLWGAKYYKPEFFNTVEPFLVLFFLFYVAIPVLYALAGREKNGKVDGTLLFGTPLLAFPMQAGLLADREDTLPLALSAVVVAAIYAGLALWARSNQRLRVLAQSSAAMGVVFVTLAVPLALSARWTSAAWALQGLGMVWLGLRQERRLTRWTGLLLLGLAGVAWVVSLFDNDPSLQERFLLNGQAMNLGLLAIATFGASWLYDRAGKSRVLAILLFLGGLFWWILLGIHEIAVNLEPDSDATAYGIFAALTAVLAALLRRPMAWPRVGWLVTLGALASLPLALLALEPSNTTWFDLALLAWWGIMAALLLSLRALLEPRSHGLMFGHLAVFITLSAALGLSLARVLEQRFGMADGWLLPASLAPLALLAGLAWRRPQWAGWPVADAFDGWRNAWLAIAGAGLGLGWLIGQFMPGGSAPLPWLPLLNPLELSLLLGLLVMALGLRERGPGPAGWPLWASAALLTLTMSVLRACHHLADLPWTESILSSRLAQASLTIAWCVAGVVAWILGSRRHDRPLWWIGAALLGVVCLKLLFVDRQFIGNITGVVSFIAVGLLFVIVGRIAPTPPRSEST
ncbi:DUF2339 domain-containing protein [Arenimonas terrae]|uniref:DUF2339 domain-containing protein n=1 Tax=Arenimonas terrae TaxID=2546226 RepID=A0A5C4RVL2_9GAMM|nr:DUF2339 domain-containing protein [Arenimonas terrae]TNJ34881.1 DUF2339 domain-containing protein [Arenimonas terrae]